jgi:hypothetical protein
MAAGRSLKALVGRRRHLDEEGEDDEGPVMVDDSQSEGSVLTEMDEGDDEDEAGSVGDGQAVSGANGSGSVADGASEGTAANGRSAGKKSRKTRNKAGKKEGEQADHQADLFRATADTEAMMKGVRLADAGEGAIQFGEMDEPVHIPSAGRAQGGALANGRGERPVDRQKREQLDNRPKRTADPAFIPNRGNFFMHDTRGANGQGPVPNRGAPARGRGRGVPPSAVPSAPLNPPQRQEKASEMPWKHDLHEVINEESQAAAAQNKMAQQHREDSARIFARPVLPAQAPRQPQQPATLSFDSTIPVAKGQARVLLPGMKSAVMGSELNIKKYIRLPNHRPPLRRDKPVRVFIPNLGPRYIFPSMDRSFIFIPRQMRPNQRGFGNNNYQQRNTGGHGYSSRRTSMYGGSIYSASIAASRRSSIARDTFSPVSFASGFGGQSRPVVRLPHNGQFMSNNASPAGPLSGHQTPTGQVLHTYPLPQNGPTFNTPLSTVHQPRPQKQFSVTGIESPAALHQAKTPAIDEQQPFQNQLPTHMAEQSAYHQHPQAHFYPQQPQYGYSNQINQAGTPLSGIPELQAFQQNAMYYPQYPTQQNMYYQPPMHMYMPQAQGYMPPQQQQQQHQAPPHDSAQSQHQQQVPPQQQQDDPSAAAAPSGMVAHESNGMVFYLPASEAQQQSQSTQEHYQPAESFVPSYAMPGLPPPTPAPEGGYYYPANAVDLGVGMGMGMYYPQQSQQ